VTIIPWILLDVIAALVILGILYQLRGQIFTLVRFRAMRGDDPRPALTRRPRWLSTQPAPNPDRIPRWLAQRMGPFPMTPYGGDWNFFCYVHIAPGRPVRIRSKRVDCRHANITLYAPEHLRGERSSAPPSLDAEQLVCEDDGTYEIVIAHEASGARNRLDPAGSRHGILALRHYVFMDGIDMHYPEISSGDEIVIPGRVVSGVRSMFPRDDRPQRLRFGGRQP
jgi:hypothetical protein